MSQQALSITKEVLDLAKKEFDLATKNLDMAAEAFNIAQNKRDLLRQYRQSYIERLANNLGANVQLDSNKDLIVYFKKLDQAIMEQHEVVESTRQQLSIQHQLWQESQRKKLSLEALAKASSRSKSHI